MGSCYHQCQVWHQQNLSQHHTREVWPTPNTRVCSHLLPPTRENLGYSLVDCSSKHEDLFSGQLFALYRGFTTIKKTHRRQIQFPFFSSCFKRLETPLKNITQKYPSPLHRRASNWSPEPVSRCLVFLCCREMHNLSLSASKSFFYYITKDARSNHIIYYVVIYSVTIQ